MRRYDNHTDKGALFEDIMIHTLDDLALVRLRWWRRNATYVGKSLFHLDRVHPWCWSMPTWRFLSFKRRSCTSDVRILSQKQQQRRFCHSVHSRVLVQDADAEGFEHSCWEVSVEERIWSQSDFGSWITRGRSQIDVTRSDGMGTLMTMTAEYRGLVSTRKQ